ncbi:MAG: hypothetical protein LBC70_02450, partial [Chitinispirillales bacterium]|nr:hypothetical protein [Chitinispirillales bacterium]
MATKNNHAPKPKPRKEPATYHDAVFTAFRYILREYVENGDITLQDERRLSKQPLKIDIMIIKKKRDVDIETSWGKIFRGHNIIEYKSPADSLVSLSVFNKVIHGYTGVYASQENVSLTDMSATIVCFKRPVELFETLKSELNYKILCKDKGIYYILQKGAVVEKSLAIQVLVSSELPDSDVALKELKKKFDKAARVKIAEFIRN